MSGRCAGFRPKATVTDSGPKVGTDSGLEVAVTYSGLNAIVADSGPAVAVTGSGLNAVVTDSGSKAVTDSGSIVVANSGPTLVTASGPEVVTNSASRAVTYPCPKAVGIGPRSSHGFWPPNLTNSAADSGLSWPPVQSCHRMGPEPGW